MRTTARLSVATAALGVLAVTGAPAALAQTAEYPGTTDTDTQDTGVLSGVTTSGSTAGSAAGDTTVSNGRSAPSSLPFTGGEVVLIAAAGAAAVAAGAGMVVGGRRRGSSTR